MAAGAAVGPVTVPPAEAVEHVVVAVEHHRHVRWIHVASPSGSHGCPRTARPSMNATDWQISDHNPVADRRGPDAQRHGDAIVTIPALQAAGLSPNTFVAAARIVPASGSTTTGTVTRPKSLWLGRNFGLGWRGTVCHPARNT